jgi:uncharacterized protein
MILTTNKIFIDSSVLIETYKGNKIDFYDTLVSNTDNKFYINDIVLSEYLYYILDLSSWVSPRTLQQKEKIANILNKETAQVNILKRFLLLSGNQSFLFEVPKLMSDYNLLPNDAIILVTCKLHGTKLASHDSDFIIPCESENVELLRDV